MPGGGAYPVRRSKRFRSKRLRGALVTCLLAITLQPNGVRAEEGGAGSAAAGPAAGLCTLIYSPLKITYAALGLVIGGIAWGLSAGDASVLHALVTPSIRGDYVVTPDHIRRRRKLEFFGREPAYRRAEDVPTESRRRPMGDSGAQAGSQRSW